MREYAHIDQNTDRLGPDAKQTFPIGISGCKGLAFAAFPKAHLSPISREKPLISQIRVGIWLSQRLLARTRSGTICQHRTIFVATIPLVALRVSTTSLAFFTIFG
jgi:hypothetical protein